MPFSYHIQKVFKGRKLFEIHLIGSILVFDKKPVFVKNSFHPPACTSRRRCECPKRNKPALYSAGMGKTPVWGISLYKIRLRLYGHIDKKSIIFLSDKITLTTK
jgi:hypothetical protein